MGLEPREVTLPDSGVTLLVKFVGPLLMNDLRKAAARTVAKQGFAKPEPPVHYPFPDRPERGEANTDDPAYLAALAEYDAARGMAFTESLLRYGVEYELTEADRAWVAALRADTDLELPADDKQLVITRRIVTTTADLLALQEAILGYAQPTEGEVGAATASFRG